MPEIRITMQDVRASGHCVQGIRTFCVAHGIDLRRLSREGIPLSEVDHIDDVNLEHLRERARERATHG